MVTRICPLYLVSRGLLFLRECKPRDCAHEQKTNEATMFGLFKTKASSAEAAPTGAGARGAEEVPLNTRWDDSLPREVQVDADWSELLERAHTTAEAEHILDMDAFNQQLLAPAECAAIVDKAERVGFGRTNYPKAYRGNLRLIVTDIALAEALWARLAPHAPATQVDEHGTTWRAIGLNECFRLAKYFPGDEFAQHCDAPFERSAQERSMYTVNVYLNGGFEGGSTRFFADSCGGRAEIFAVRPEAGKACVFRQPPEQAYQHDGERLRSGVKYLLRTDVMYRVDRPSETSGEE